LVTSCFRASTGPEEVEVVPAASAGVVVVVEVEVVGTSPVGVTVVGATGGGGGGRTWVVSVGDLAEMD